MDTNTPEGIGNDEPMSLDEAIKAYASGTPEEVHEDQTEDDEQDTEEEAELSDDEEEDGEPHEEDDAEEGDEEEEVKAEGRFVSKDGKVRLPDGSVSTIDDLINGNLREADYTRKTQEVSAIRKQTEDYRAQLSQYEQRMSFLQDMTMKILQAKMPVEPDPSRSLEDPLGYIHEKAMYDRSLSEYQRYQAELQQAREHQTALSMQEQQRYVREQHAELARKIPELQDPSKRPKMIETLVKTAEKYGVGTEELGNITDHRFLVALRDLSRLSSLQGDGAAKVKDKIANKPPVSTGSKRLSPGAQRGRAVDTAMQRLNKSGTLKDGIAAYLATQKQR